MDVIQDKRRKLNGSPGKKLAKVVAFPRKGQSTSLCIYALTNHMAQKIGSNVVCNILLFTRIVMQLRFPILQKEKPAIFYNPFQKQKAAHIEESYFKFTNI